MLAFVERQKAEKAKKQLFAPESNTNYRSNSSSPADCASQFNRDCPMGKDFTASYERTCLNLIPIQAVIHPHSRDSCSDTDSGICADGASDVSNPERSSKDATDKRYKPGYKLLPSYPLCQPTSGYHSESRHPQRSARPFPPILSGVGSSSLPSRTPRHRSQSQPRVRSPRQSPTTKTQKVRFADEVDPRANFLRQRSAITQRQLPPNYDLTCERLGRIRVDYDDPSEIQPPNPQLSESVDHSHQPGYYYTTGDPYISGNVRDKQNQTASMTAAKSLENLANSAIRDRRESGQSANGRQPSRVPQSTSFNSFNPCVMPSESFENIVMLDSHSPQQNKIRTMPMGPSRAQQWAFNTPLTKRFGCQETKARVSTNTAERLKANPINGTGPIPKADQEPVTVSPDRKIKVRLVGLDCQGLQTVELEKVDPGPFGFYIATGTFKRKKGVFISRISVRSLLPILSVGDQLLEIDGCAVKGRTLEQVQAMMADKSRISLKVLPVIAR